MNILYPLISVILVSLISILFAIPFLLKKKISSKTLLFLVCISVGVLLATVFIDFLPEAISHGGYSLNLAFYLLFGFLIMFILEKFVHFHHHKESKKNECEHGHRTQSHVGHGHAYNLAPINLIGDGVHNFIDGLVIAGSYAVDLSLGVVATISILFHEIPQELADFVVLIYAGMSKQKALIFNGLSALTAMIGVLVGISLVGRLEGFIDFIIPFAAGNFLYIAASNLVPQLHDECEFKDTIMHLFAILLGIGIIVFVNLYGPAHMH